MKIHEFRWIEFEPGDLVTPTSPQSPLERGEVYKVVEAISPVVFVGQSTVFVENWPYGLNPEHLKLVEKEAENGRSKE